jgi:dTDP-4-dehydrorhamnose 3,5-epimerase
VGRLRLSETPLRGLVRIERRILGDRRGYFERLYCADELGSVLGDRRIVQINHSYTQAKGTLRGLHFQHPPSAELKIVSCLRGEVFDVAVDLRAGSATRLQWHAERLSADNHYSLLIPEGFAHGFQTLSEDCELLYLHTAAYDPAREDGLDCLDPAIGIDWPLPVGGRSPRDQSLPRVTPEFEGIPLP